MKPQVRALELGIRDRLPELVDSYSDPPARVVRELIEAGYMTAIDASSMDGPAYLGPAITLAGRGYLDSIRGRKPAPRNKGRGQQKRPSGVTVAFGGSGVWPAIEKEYGVSKRALGKKINFVEDEFKRMVIFRDIEQAFVLAHNGFCKPSVILAGGVVEELIRCYLAHKNVRPKDNTLDSYIKACETNGFMKGAIHRLADSVRQFRNIVHLERETSPRHTVSKATAKGAVSSIFTIANELGA